MRRVPPLESIEAFSAAMRAASFREAADGLAVSPSAFSRRIARLEDHLGRVLFERKGGRAVPTSAARDLQREIAPALDDLLRATTDSQPAPASTLRILVAPSLAAEWLMPRLGEALAHIGIERPAIDIGKPGCALDPRRHDVALLARKGPGDGEPADVLAPVVGAVVSAPVLAGDRTPPTTLADVAAFNRLDMRFPEGLWRRWSEYHSAPMPRDRDGARFASVVTMYEAASAGFGVALAIPLVTTRRLRDGSLKPCFRGVAPLGFDYAIVYRDARTRRRKDVRALAEWLRAEAERTNDEFLQLAA